MDPNINTKALRGRLLDPSMSLSTDPRTHPSLLTALAAAGRLNPIPPASISSSSTLSEIFAYCSQMHHDSEKIYASVPQDLATDVSLPEVVYGVLECPGPDGNIIKLHVYEPAAKAGGSGSGGLPGLVYIHGGGMIYLSTTNPPHERWMKSLAATGLIVIGVDFRNGWTEEGWNHFPVGLNDCAEAVKWIKANEKELGIGGKIVLQGESGGANLSIATALKAKQEGWVDAIDGVYASVPYISGVYGWEKEKLLEELPSLVECDGYALLCQRMAISVEAYDPGAKNATNPLAWPYHASVEVLKGLPPFVVSVNELDPLKDEGIVFWRNLVSAGVKAVGKVNLGITHAAEMIYRGALPEENIAAIGDIKRFIDSL
jgi:acetyl esterase